MIHGSRDRSSGSGDNYSRNRRSGPGRPRGSRTKLDLPQMIMNNAARAGFMLKDDKGKPAATGLDGADGYLLWCAVNEPKTYMALLARILPYYIVNEMPDKTIISRDEAIAQLRERGLPIGLIDHMRRAPEVLEEGEDPDPYKIKDVTPDGTGK